MDDGNMLVRYAYTLMAAVAGAVTALAFMRWKKMSRGEIVLTLFVGASFAIFVTPWIAHGLIGVDIADTRTIAALTYVAASGSNALIPLLIEWFARVSGLPRSEDQP